MDTGVLAREQSDQMYADVAKEVAGEKQKVSGKPEQDKGQAEKAAKLAGLAFAELGDKDVVEPQALGAALDVADKSGIYDKVKSKFLGAVDKRLHCDARRRSRNCFHSFESISIPRSERTPEKHLF